MSSDDLSILETRETVFYGDHDGKLCQWIGLDHREQTGCRCPATVLIAGGGDEAATRVTGSMPGVREYRVYAPTLWPCYPAIDQAPVRLTIAGQTWLATVGVGHHRPWSLYLLSDVCTDYCWAYSDEQACRADDARLVEAEMGLAESTAGEPEAIRNHYNMVVSREVEFFLDHYPHQSEKAFRAYPPWRHHPEPHPQHAIDPGQQLGGAHSRALPGSPVVQEHGFDITCANHQETPTMTWAMATVLAECGIGHLVKSILALRVPLGQEVGGTTGLRLGGPGWPAHPRAAAQRGLCGGRFRAARPESYEHGHPRPGSAALLAHWAKRTLSTPSLWSGAMAIFRRARPI